MSDSTNKKLSDSILARIAGGHVAAETSRGDDARAGHIDVHAADGHRYAFEYVRVLWVRLDDAATLHIHFETHTATVGGRNLEGLYERLMRREEHLLKGEGERYDKDVQGKTIVHTVHVQQKPGPGRVKGEELLPRADDSGPIES
ncbi:MAG: hypothetical protein AABZ53_16275 [Planctomycetota bacterium]